MKNRRHLFAKTAGLGAGGLLLSSLSACATEPAPEPPPQRPNILFISIDDLKPLIGAMGNPHIKTPNMDRLANQGRPFVNSYCQLAVCGPSRNSILTGLRPDTTRCYRLTDKVYEKMPSAVSIGQYFKEHGYWTEANGKIFHHGTDDARAWSIPWTEGVKTGELWYLNPENRRRVEAQTQFKQEQRAQGANWLEIKNALLEAGLQKPSFFENEDVPDEAYGDGDRCQYQIGRLRELAKKDQPFFFACGFAKPHLPFNAPKKYRDLYSEEDIQLPPFMQMPEGAPDYAGTHFGWEVGDYEEFVGYTNDTLPKATTRDFIHAYYACVSYVDAQVGKLLDELEALGIADNTLICLWGDHGFHLGEHGLYSKFTNYEDGTRVPLIIYKPGMKHPGVHCSTPVELVDVYPTLCALAGLPIPENLDGQDASLFVENPHASWDKPARSQYGRQVDEFTDHEKNAMGYTLRTGRYRYTEWVTNPEFVQGEFYKHPYEGNVVLSREFYDYEADPLETRNLIDDPAYADIIREHAALLHGEPAL